MDALTTTLLRRGNRLYLPDPGPHDPPDGEQWVRAVEADLMEHGWLLDAQARHRLASLDVAVRTQWADWLLAVADEEVGAHRFHTPLYRQFPDTPTNPDAVFVGRVLAFWFQDSDVRCVLWRA